MIKEAQKTGAELKDQSKFFFFGKKATFIFNYT